MPLDGLFHRIKVRVKRGGYDVRARNGYWAPKAEEVAAAERRAAAAVLPPAVATAFGSLPAVNAPRLIEVHAGIRPLPDGTSELTLGWAPLAGRQDRSEPAAVTAAIKTKDKAFDAQIDPGGTPIVVPPGPVQIALTILDKSGEVLDREKRTIEVEQAGSTPLALSTPMLYRVRGPAEMKAFLATERPPLYAGRLFTRTDRLIVRTSPYGSAAAEAQVTARLIDRRGATLVTLPLQRTADRYQLDLPLASVAAGEFAIVFDAVSGDARTESMVAFRVAIKGAGCSVLGALQVASAFRRKIHCVTASRAPTRHRRE